MSTVEIEAAIEKLSRDELRELADWLNSFRIEETPEMLASIDEGIRSLETEPTVTTTRGAEGLWAGSRSRNKVD